MIGSHRAPQPAAEFPAIVGADLLRGLGDNQGLAERLMEVLKPEVRRKGKNGSVV